MKGSYIVGVLAVLLIVGSGGVVYLDEKAPPKPHVPSALDGFATCLKDAGATFYGAFWCPHCKSQKELFKDADEFLPYVECSTPNGQAQTQVCKDKNIESYPTWIFKDGTRSTGELSLEVLGQKTGCVVPGTSATTTATTTPV